MANVKADWEALQGKYVTGRMSMKDLAAEAGISVSQLRAHARAEGWQGKRALYRQNNMRKSVARAGAKQTRRLEKLMSSGTKLSAEIELIMKDLDRELHTHTYLAIKKGGVTDGMRAEQLNAIDAKKLLNIAKALREATAAMRDLYGIPTAQEKATIELGTERLAIMRRAQEAKEDTNRVEEINVVLGDGLEDYKG